LLEIRLFRAFRSVTSAAGTGCEKGGEVGRAKVLFAAAALSAGAVVVTAGPAAAEACQVGGRTACVAVSYQVDRVKSIRVNGRCLIGSSGKYSSVEVDRWNTPDVLTYGGSRCEGGTHNSARVTWGSEDPEGYRWVWIRA
jgi:hypothetical protein